MCIILDANMFGDFLTLENEDMKPVKKWIEQKGGKIMHSNTEKLQRELRNSTKMADFFAECKSKGRLKTISTKDVAREEIDLNSISLESDDHHIIALAIAGGCKLLVSKDKALHKDFKEICEGGVYQTKRHARLLTKDVCP